MNNKKFKKMMHTIGYIPQSLRIGKKCHSVLDNILIGALPRLNKLQSFLNNSLNMKFKKLKEF